MRRVFLLGDPIAHSLSPAMHRAAFRALGLDWRYELLETPRGKLPEALARLRAEDCAGANVTIPHKEPICSLLDALGESARKIGAVNTIVRHGDRLIGENTDAAGFTQALHDASALADRRSLGDGRSVDPRNARVVIFGAGGAACAVAFA